tara:strand:- start:161 stop:340 length:180 start_codon:yes stop_codon:yes gene_type:complete
MLEEVRDLQELGQSLGELIGIPTEQKTEVSVSALNEPAQLNELLRTLLVEFFGMEVRGL